MNEKRGPWYLVTGLVLGIAIGLIYAWLIQPLQYTNTAPRSLRADFKDQYRALIASAHMANGDLLRAKARLELLEDADLYQALAEQAQRTLAENRALNEARALGILAIAVGQTPASVAAPEQATTPAAGSFETSAPTEISTTPQNTLDAETGGIPTGAIETPLLQATSSSVSANSLLPPHTPTPTLGALFVLEQRDPVCDPEQPEPLIQIQTKDANEQPVPGVEIAINWEGGENHFFTGLKPELGLGYADFTMTPNVSYNMRLSDGGQLISNLSPHECEAPDGKMYWGGWLLVFKQP